MLAYPSLYEGFGLPTLEAMAAGVPVVTTTAGALPEVVGDAALLVEPGDSDALGTALEVVLTDEAERAALVERGPPACEHVHLGGVRERVDRSLQRGGGEPQVTTARSTSVLLVVEQLRRRVPGGAGTYVAGLLKGLGQLADSGEYVPRVTLLASRKRSSGDGDTRRRRRRRRRRTARTPIR